MNKLIQYFKGVQSEMAKVSWPNRSEVTSATTLVVAFSVVFSVVVWIFDQILTRIMGFLLNM